MQNTQLPDPVPLHRALADLGTLRQAFPRTRWRVYRRSPGGAAPSFALEVEQDTANLPNVEAFVQERLGGGTFEIAVCDPGDAAKLLLPIIAVSIEGTARPLRAVEPPQSAAQFAGGAWQPPAWTRPPWQPPAPPSARSTESAELVGMRRRLEELERERVERSRQDAEGRAEQQHREMMGAIGKLAVVMQRPVEPPKPAIDWAAVAGLVGSVLTVSKEREALQAQQHARVLELASTRKDSSGELLKTMAPFLAPLIKDLIAARSPQAQADLVATLAENQLTSVGLMAKMVSEFAAQSGANDQPPWWLPMVQETMRGVTNAAEKLTQTSKAAVSGPTMPASAHAPQAAPATPPSAGPDMANALSGLNGQQIAQLIFNDPRLPAEFKSPEWFRIIAAMHDKVAADQVAGAFAKQLRDVDEQQKPMPEALKAIWDTEQPEQLLEQVFAALPIWAMDTSYCREVARRTVAVLTEPELKTQTAPQPAPQTAEPHAPSAGQGAVAPAPEPVPYTMGFAPAPAREAVGA